MFFGIFLGKADLWNYKWFMNGLEAGGTWAMLQMSVPTISELDDGFRIQTYSNER